MAAGKYNFTIEQGTTLDFEVQYTDSNGDPVDFSHYDHARMQIRSDYGGTQIIYLSSSIGGLPPDYGSPDSPTSDGTGLSLSGSSRIEPITSGKIGVYISAYSSSAFTFNEAKYDLEIVPSMIGMNVIENIINVLLLIFVVVQFLDNKKMSMNQYVTEVESKFIIVNICNTFSLITFVIGTKPYLIISSLCMMFELTILLLIQYQCKFYKGLVILFCNILNLTF